MEKLTEVYERRGEEVDLDGSDSLSRKSLEVEYQTNRGNIRSKKGNGSHYPTNYDVENSDVFNDRDSNDFVVFYGGNRMKGGSTYLFDTEEEIIYTYGENRKYEEVSDNILGVYYLEYPGRAPIVGDTDSVLKRYKDRSDITVHYLTNQGNERSFKMEVESSESTLEMRGERKSDGKNIYLSREHRREIYTWNKKIGNVTALEFPRGEKFKVTVEGKVDTDPKEIEKAIVKKIGQNDIDEISVERIGDID